MRLFLRAYLMQNNAIRDSGDNLLSIITHAFCLKCTIQFSCYQCQTHLISRIQENRHISFFTAFKKQSSFVHCTVS